MVVATTIRESDEMLESEDDRSSSDSEKIQETKDTEEATDYIQSGNLVHDSLHEVRVN